MDDMKAMMQEKLKQALAGLMPPLAPVAAIPPAAVAPVANPPVVDAPPANNNNVGGVTFECCQECTCCGNEV